MAYFSNIAASMAKGLAFTHLARFVHPELLSSGMFAIALAGYGWLPGETTEAIGQGVLIEFLMLHANVGIAVASLATPSPRLRRTLILLVGGFYFLFVIGLTLGLGAWWMLIGFLLLLWSRISDTGPDIRKPLVKEIFISMIRFFVYMLMGGICAGILTALDTSDDLKMLTWGTCYFLVLFLLRHKIARLRESTFLK